MQCSESSLGTAVNLLLIHIGQLQLTGLKEVIPDKSVIKQFHLVCTFIILCLFTFWTGMV